ncbi:MAG: sortase [Bacilli bacterium]|nr:sortase [Bacilli bacterium]
MVKRFVNILIFLFIFSLYFVSFLMIYDNFRERKLASLESNAIDTFDSLVKTEEKKEEEDTTEYVGEISYEGYTILGKIEIPRIGFTSVVLKEYTNDAMNLATIKAYGSELNEPGGFVIVGHNFRGGSMFLYGIYLLSNGDKIYITDTSGVQMEYTVYDVSRYTNPNESSIYNNYDGYNVTLLTCEDDGGATRIVVRASA